MLTLKDRDRIVTSIARHYSIVQCMAELAQLQEGLRSLPDLLAFVTGARLEPAIGFDCTPSIHFQESSPFPRANTCAMTVHLSLQHKSFDVFAYHVVFGICNTAGFGQI